MISKTPPPHTTEGVSPALQQVITTHSSNPLSVADLFGLGAVLILTLFVSRQLVVRWHTRYELHRFIASLQRMATLERQLHQRSAQAAPKPGLPR